MDLEFHMMSALGDKDGCIFSLQTLSVNELTRGSQNMKMEKEMENGKREKTEAQNSRGQMYNMMWKRKLL